MTTLRLLSYNIRSMRDDTDALVRVIRAAEADVVCIQEAPRFLRWRSKCAALSRRSGLVIVTGGRPAGSNLIMSTLAVTVTETRDLLFTKDPKMYQRGTAMALLELGPSRFLVAGTHLDLAPEPRLRHVEELHAAVDRLVPPDVPAIVVGDMNDRPGSAVWAALSSRATDAHAAVGHGDGFTYSATKPFERIDGVFVGTPAVPVSSTVLASADTQVATDHCPLLVEIELP